MFRRLVVLAAVALSVGTAMAPASASADPAPSPWTQTGYNPAGSYANIAEHLITRANVSTLTTRLSVAGARRDGQCSSGVNTTAIGESRFYLVNCGVLSARSLSDGTVLWQRKLPGYDDAVYRQLLVGDGFVVAVGQTGETPDSTAGSVDVFDEDNGRPLYHQDTDALLNVEVSGEYLVLHNFSGNDFTPHTAVERVADGSLVWQTPYGGNFCFSDAWTVGGHIYMLTCNERLRALDVATGALAWQRTGRYRVEGGDSDTTDAQHLWVSDMAQNRLLDLDPATGATKVTIDGPSGDVPPLAVLAVTSTRVFATDFTNVFAYDAATGGLLWSAPFSRVDSADWANGMLFLDNGEVLNAYTGRLLTHLPTAATYVGTGVQAVGSGNVALITGRSGRLDLLAPQ